MVIFSPVRRKLFCFFFPSTRCQMCITPLAQHGLHGVQQRPYYLLLSLNPPLRNTHAHTYVRDVGYIRAKIDIISDTQITNHPLKRRPSVISADPDEFKHHQTITTRKYSAAT